MGTQHLVSQPSLPKGALIPSKEGTGNAAVGI